MKMDFNQPFILLDLSSYIFYRGFAIHSWMAAAGIDPVEFGTERLIEKYGKVFESRLLEYIKKLKVPMGNVILAKDCPRETIWRMDTYAEYKLNRSLKLGKQLEPEVFSFTYQDMLPRLLTAHGMHMIHYKRAEADDVIAVAHGWLKTHVGNGVKVNIMSCDTDLLQLADENTTVLDFNLKPLAKGAIVGLMDVYVKYKVICGDVSDNIPAIDTKIGKVTAEKLARNPEMLAKRLEKPGVREAYERNDTLINLARIPDDIRAGVINELVQKTKST